MGCLRFLLAAFVTIGHAHSTSFLRPLGGDIAVEMFFVISGFYMALVLDEKYDKSSWHGIATFYANRAARLWPAYLAVLASVGLFWIAASLYLGRRPTEAAPMSEWLPAWSQVVIWSSNFLMIGQDVPNLFHVDASGRFTFTWGQDPGALPDGSVWVSHARPIGQAWTLGTEIWFYLLAPFLLRWPTWRLITLACVLLAIRWWLAWDKGINSYFVFPLQLPLFLAGVIAYRHAPRAGALALAPVAAVVCALGLSASGVPDGTWKWPIYAGFAFGIGALFNVTRRSRLDRVIGEQSYPIYLSHMSVFAILAVIAKRVDMSVTGEMLLLATIPVSWALYRWVERPVGSWRLKLAV